MKMPFGKFKNLDVYEVPEQYLIWVLNNVDWISPELQKEIEEELLLRSGSGVVRDRE